MARTRLTLIIATVGMTATATLAGPEFYGGHPHKITGWTAEYFEPWEFASKGNGKLHVSRDMIAALDRVRAAVGHPIQILSAFRDPDHNARVGGAKASRHTVGDAVDINLAGLNEVERHALMWHLLAEGFTSFGSYARSPNMLHADMRSAARIWRHGGGAYPVWFRKALSDWGWQRDQGPTRDLTGIYARK